MKIVITESAGKVRVGVQKEDCDPYIETLEGDLTEGLQQTPAVRERAEAAWARSPRYPVHSPPKPEKKVPEGPPKVPVPDLGKEFSVQKPLEALPTPTPASTPAPTPTSTSTSTPTPTPTPASTPAPSPSPTPTSTSSPTPSPTRGGWVYRVNFDTGGQVTYKTVHEALRILGVSQEEIDKHRFWHRWDRLPKKHQEAIERVRE